MRAILPCLCSLLCVPAVFGQRPTVADDRLVLELVAQQPDLVTPTGLSVDEQGRVWVIENHTHQRPATYQGPATDRIRVFSDFDAAGKARKATTVADGFRDAMSFALGTNGTAYLATRSTIYLLRFPDGKPAEREVLVRLETKGDYPHNGLAGFAFDGMGNMYFGLGENLGAAYKLIGSDGTSVEGSGEGGSMYVCRPDGSKLQRIATGFWNPFHHCFDAFGRLFAVDNDPDSRGPCRLMHIVPGGDYGYRFRYGRKGTHPFQSWNGELPGTLPMVAGTAEAPSGVLAYESTGLPAEYRGNLLATSWGDHVIERFTLTPRGASFGAKAQTLVRGDQNFRPVGIAVGPDGAVYFSDWVDKSYPVHGKGKLWRLRMKNPPMDDGLRPSKVAGLDAVKLGELLGHPKREVRAAAGEALAKQGQNGRGMISQVLRLGGLVDPRARLEALWTAGRMGDATRGDGARIAVGLKDTDATVRAEAVRLLGQGNTQRNEGRVLERLKDSSALVRFQAVQGLRKPESLRQIVPLLADADPFLAAAALHVLGRPGQCDLLLPHAGAADARLRLGVLLALRRTGDAKARIALDAFLKDADPQVRQAAIQWVGEERLSDFAPRLTASATQAPVTRELFLALLAANHLLAGKKADAEPADPKYLAAVVPDAAQPAAFRVLALQMLRPDHPALSVANLAKLLGDKDAFLRRQAVRTLAQRTDPKAQDLLAGLAADAAKDIGLRADAVAGLAQSAPELAPTRKLLLSLLDQPDLRRDSLRSLRGSAVQPEVEKGLLTWWEMLSPADRRDAAASLGLALKSSKSVEFEKHRKEIATLAGPRPKDETGWRTALARGGDPAAGERVFFHVNGPRCYSCHRADGRGGKIGPDLSTIGRALDRDKLIASILTPSKEIAPQFVAWSIVTRDGKARTGVIVEEKFDSTIIFADSQGKLEAIKRQDIEERHALTTSIMPDNLHDLMTPREFLDLIAFLSERR